MSSGVPCPGTAPMLIILFPHSTFVEVYVDRVNSESLGFCRSEVPLKEREIIELI